MLLAVDAGNTNTVFAVYDGETHVSTWRLKTDAERTADEYIAVLFQLFTRDALNFDIIDCAVISSVVPGANEPLRQLCQSAFGCEAQMVDAKAVSPFIEIKTAKPEEVGADRLVNALAVVTLYQAPAIVVDFGTATNFDVVDSSPAYIGGVIAPGVNLSMNALHAAAAKLPKISIKKPATAIGNETVSAMQSGIYWGYISMIEGMVARISKELGEKPLVIATGGLSPLFAGGTDVIDEVDDELTLKGLVYLYNQSRKALAA